MQKFSHFKRIKNYFYFYMNDSDYKVFLFIRKTFCKIYFYVEIYWREYFNIQK